MRTSDLDPITVEIFHRQIRLATFFVLAVFGLLLLRLWFLQVAGGLTYRSQSENNRIRLQDIPAVRGMIYDSKGELLVGNLPAFRLYVIPEEIQDRRDLLDRLHRLIGLEKPGMEEKIRATARRFPFKPVLLKRDLTRDEVAVIETHRFNLPGVMIKVEPRRHYYHGELAFHVLGYMGEISETQLRSGRYPGSKAGDWIGRSGVERKWEQALSGLRGGEQVEVDAIGRKIRVLSRKSPVSGANVYLTLDERLQTRAEAHLSGKRGAIVALDPRDGAVLAMASQPSRDPNAFIWGLDPKTWQSIVHSEAFPLQNRALSGMYPPGSVFKIVLALAGLAEGVVRPDETITCTGTYRLGSHEYRCWKKWGHGKVNLHRALAESCDVYFYKLGEKLGVDRIARYARQFGFGTVTGFDVDQEQRGLVPDRDWKRKRFGVPWQAGETLSLAIGQSFLLVTPIQVASFISALFNGGVLYRPQVTQWVGKPPEERIHAFVPEIRGRLDVAQRHVDLVRKALIDVVNGPHGTGSKAKLEDVIVAGKTGTAQVVALNRGKELEAEGEIPWRYRDHAWFTAVAPADQPLIALAVLIEHGGHGGSAAAPIAADLIQAYLDTRNGHAVKPRPEGRVQPAG